MNSTLRITLRIARYTALALTVAAVAGYVYLIESAPPARSPEIFLQLGHSSGVRVVAFRPDGKTLASGSDDNTIKLWNGGSGQLLRTLSGHQSRVSSVAFAPDGKTLASGSDDTTIKLWDGGSGELLRTLSGHQSRVSSVAFAPDGKTLASGSDDTTIKLWDGGSGQLLRTLSGHQGRVSSVAFAPDGKTLASGSDDTTIKLWDGGSGELLRTLSGHQSRVSSVAFAPDGKTLASGSYDNRIKLWDTSSGQLLRTLSGHQGRVSSVAFAPDGKTLASGSDDTTIKLWDGGSGQLLRTLSGHQGRVSSVAFAPDGKTLASGSDDTTIKLWNGGSGQLLRTLSGHLSRVSSVAFAPDGKTLASGSDDTTIKLWDGGSGELLRTLSGHQSRVSSVAFAPDGKTLASGSDDTTIKLWNGGSGQLLRTLSGHQIRVSSVAFAPDGKTFASGSYDNRIKLWDASSGQLLRTLSRHQRGVSSVAFAPDGKTLASGSDDNTIKLWDGGSGQLLRTLSGHQSRVSSVAFAPDGKTLASGSDDTTIKLWNGGSGQLLRTLSGHQSRVSSVAFAPDGKTLASGSDDTTIKLWDGGSGQLLRTLSGHQSRVSSVAFAPDGKTLASGSGDATTRWWRVKAQGPSLVATGAAGGQFLTYEPGALRYKTSRQAGELEPAAIRFNGQALPVYPLDYFRKELMLPREQLFTGQGRGRPTIAPKPLRLAWDNFENKTAWIVAAGLTYGAIMTITLVTFRRADPLQVAKQYFTTALATEVQQVGQGLLRLGTKGSVPGLRTLSSECEAFVSRKAVPPFTFFLGQEKLYVVYKDQPPTADQLAELRKQRSAQIIPISARLVERALAEKNATAENLRGLEEPFVTRTDPYDEQRPVEAEVLFFGRADALENIPTALLQGQHVAMFGLRKVGKTSLLNRLRDRLSASPCVYIDCQGYAPVAIDLFNAILTKLHDELKRVGVKSVPRYDKAQNANSFREQFLRLYQVWSKHAAASRVILVFDELDKYFPERKHSANEATLRECVAIFRMLRALAQEHRCLSVLAVAYRPDINRQNLLTEALGENPMFMSFQEYFLGFLDEEDTRTMIREIGRWRSIEWEDDALKLVFEFSGGHPLLARFIASDACEQGRKKHVSTENVQEVGSEIRRAFHRHRLGKYLDESVWRLLRADEREVLRLVAVGNPRASGEWIGRELNDAVANLLHFGLFMDQSGENRVQGTLLKNWVQRNEAQYET